MKITHTIIASSLILSSVYGATLNVSNLTPAIAGSRILVDSNNNVLSSGYAAVGYFTSFSAMPDFATSTGLQIENDFNMLGTSSSSFVFDFSGNAVPGAVSFSGASPTLAGSEFIGKQAYVVLGNAATLATSTEAFIYATGVLIPEDPSSPISINLSLETLPGQILLGSGDGIGNVFVGSFDTGNVTNGLKTAVLVPEPSSLLLSIIGLSALLRRKR